MTARAPRAAPMAEWRNLSFGERERGRWVEAGVLTPSLASEWRRFGFLPVQVAPWVRVGVLRGRDADLFRRCGLVPADLSHGVTDPQQWAFTHVAEVPCTPQWGALHGVCSPGFARIGHEQGQSPRAVTLLAWALPRTGGHRFGHTKHLHLSVSVTSYWNPEQERANEQHAADLAGLDWEDAATCLKAGLSVPETLAHLREGRDMDPVRLLAGLTS